MKGKMAALCFFVFIFLAAFCGCSKMEGAEESGETSEKMRNIIDGLGRQVTIPEKVESIVCLNVGALRYTCYMQAQDLVVGVEDYEKEQSISRGYNYVNYDRFKDLPIVGTNGEAYPEEIIAFDPDVIVLSTYEEAEADTLQEMIRIPVAAIPGSDAMMDENAYETFRILAEIYGKEERARELIDYMDSIKEDLEKRTASLSWMEKPSVYVGGISYKGAHGFEGTEAGYGPLAAIHADNLADKTGKEGAFDIDPEQVLSWDPEVIFLDYNGINLIKEDYASNPEYYQQLTAVQEGRVYSQISFRSSAANLDTALADTYYAASILYPEAFGDIDPVKKAEEIFEKLLGRNFYEDLKENGYEFRKINIGE
ncbi:MAG: iron ABC transporter substrate-binding protein [Ruminococcus sp.]|jgi:iron complex transport system substrate-binding protein